MRASAAQRPRRFAPPDGSSRSPLRQVQVTFVVRSLVVALCGWSAGLFFVIFSPFWAGDSSDYSRIAASLAHGDGFAIYPTSPTVSRLPVYPLFISLVYRLFGPDPVPVLFVQTFLVGLGAWLVFLLGRLWLDEPVAAFGAAMAGFYPNLAFYAGTLLSETLAFAIMAMALLLSASMLERPRMTAAIAAGVALGLAALTSPRLAFLPIGVVAILLWRQGPRSLPRAALPLVIGYAAVLAPWTARNLATFGAPIPFSMGQAGLNLWLAAARWPLYDYSFYTDPGVAEREPVIARLQELIVLAPQRERELFHERQKLEDDLTRDAVSKIASDPWAYATSQLRNYPRLWLQPAMYAGRFRPPFDAQNANITAMIAERHWLSVAARLVSVTVFTVGLFGGVALGTFALRRHLPSVALLYLPAVYVAIVQAPLWADERYSVLSHPFLWLVAGAGLVWAAREWLTHWALVRSTAR